MPSLNSQSGKNEQNKVQIEELVEKFQKGDREAFAKLYDYFVDKVYKYFYYKTTSQEEAFDLTETVFLKVWENAKSYKKKLGSSFNSWVFRIDHNLFVDYYRLNKPSAELDTNEADQRAEASPVFLAEQSLSRRNLQGALEKLKDTYREVITLAYINGLDNTEVAEVMKKSEGGLRVLKFRALKELKKILQEMGIKY
jgi:RNA polymerase sigma-70 factor, ECF subfamily